MVVRSTSLLQHPLRDVRRAVLDRETCRLTRVEKTDGIDIHEINLGQVEDYSRSVTLELGLHLDNAVASKLSAQTNARLALAKNSLDLQRHRSLF